jgi:hypothetical protein
MPLWSVALARGARRGTRCASEVPTLARGASRRDRPGYQPSPRKTHPPETGFLPLINREGCLRIRILHQCERPADSTPRI